MSLDKPIEFIRNHPRLVVAQDFEVACQRFNLDRIEYRQGEATLRDSQDDWWIRLRVLHRNKPGIATTTTLNEDSLNRLVENALLSAEQSHPDPWFRFPIWANTGAGNERAKQPVPVDFQRSLFHLIDLANTPFLEKYDWWNVETQLLRRSEREQKRFIQVAAQQSWVLGSLQESFWEKSDQSGRLKSLVQLAQLLESCEPAPETSPRAFSLSPRAMAPLLDHLSEFFLATKVDSESSPFKRDHLNHPCVSTAFSLCDDGLDTRLASYAPFDLDGIATQKTVLTEQGQLKGLLYDSYSGIRDNCRSTGNSSRGPKSTEAQIKARKLVMNTGFGSAQNFWSRNPKAFLVEGWSKMELNEKKEVTGTAFGYWVESGKKTRPVKIEHFTLSLPRLMKNVVGTGSETLLFGACDCPEVFVEEAT